MRKLRPPSIVTLAIMTTITIVFWVFFSVYRVLTTKIPTDVPPEILEPVTVSLDSETLAEIDKRVYFEKGEVQQFAILTTPIPGVEEIEPTPTVELEISTEAAELKITAPESEATESGEF